MLNNAFNIFFSKAFSFFIVGLLLAFNSNDVLAQEQQAEEMGLTNYEYFIVYPHLEKGFSALEEGNKQRVITEFERALEIVPGNVALILHIVEAHRHFGDDELARKFLEKQIIANPTAEALQQYLSAMDIRLEPIYTVSDLLAAEKLCNTEPTLECRSRVSYAALHLEQLPIVQKQLQDEGFLDSSEGREIEEALLQRAMFLERWEIADDIFSQRFAQSKLSEAEYRQWFHAILAGELNERFLKLQEQGVFRAPEDYIQYANNLLSDNKQKELSDYLISSRPLFPNEEQERRWIFLLMSVGQESEELLNNYQAQYLENRNFIAAHLLPHALAANRADYLAKVLADLPAEQYLQERYDLSISMGNKEQALTLAKKLYERDRRSLESIDIYTWRLLSLGEDQKAFEILLKHYPFIRGGERTDHLIMRLFALAKENEQVLDSMQKQHLLQPLGHPLLREQQAQLPWVRGDCDVIRALLGDHSQAYSAYSWSLLGECYREDIGGMAVYAFERALAVEPSLHRVKALAYQHFEVKDYESALKVWKRVAIEEMSREDLQAATLTAELAGDMDWQWQLLQEQRKRGFDNTHIYWLSKAKYFLDEDKDEELDKVLQYLDRSIEIKPTALAFSLRADIYRQQKKLNKAHKDLLRAIDLEPSNRLYVSALGYLLWDKERFAEAKAVQEYALVAMPYDLDLVRQLSFISERLDQPEDAQNYIRRVVDDIDYQAEIKPLDPKQRQERFNFRRMHEDVARKWTINFDTSIGLSSNSYQLVTTQEGTRDWADSNHNSFAQLEAEYRIGKNQILQDDLLSVYGRVITSTEGTGSILPTKVPMLGLGVRWKPWREHVVFAAVERLIPIDHKGKTDTLLRLSGSFFNDGKYSDDWHPNGLGWFAQNLYLDGAHYINDNRQSWVADYRISWHQKIKEGQTIEPYAHMQTQGFRADSNTRAAHGVGVGVRWNIWFGQTLYDAWPHKLSVGIEAQQVFKTVNADARKRNNILLTFGLRW